MQKGSKKAKYSKEVEEIKRLRDLNMILKAGDVENALLSNSAKDSETLNDNVLDSLMSKADSYETGKSDRGLEIIEKLTTNSGSTRTVKQKKMSVKRNGGRTTAKRSIHIKKAKSKKRR